MAGSRKVVQGAEGGVVSGLDLLMNQSSAHNNRQPELRAPFDSAKRVFNAPVSLTLSFGARALCGLL